jgi:hypothetical protein
VFRTPTAEVVLAMLRVTWETALAASRGTGLASAVTVKLVATAKITATRTSAFIFLLSLFFSSIPYKKNNT